MAYMKSKDPNASRIRYRGKLYEIHDAFPTKTGASGEARGLRTLKGRIHQHHRTLAIVVDLSTEAGRLRWGVFVARGEKI